MISLRSLLLTLFLGTSLVPETQAFAVLKAATTKATTTSIRSSTTSDDNNGTEGSNTPLGATERLLLERQKIRELGLVQEYGRTIKKDGWDGVRTAVWMTFHAAQAVFSVLAVALVVAMALNTAGYGYYWDHDGVHVDTISSINQMRLFEAETARFAAAAAEQAAMMR